MNKELFIILAIVCIVTHIIRTIYEILKHKKFIRPGRLSFIIVFTNMLLLWASWFGLCSLDIKQVFLPQIISYLGMTMVILGIALFLAGLITIKALESYEGDLITHGIYSKIRHPMYLAFILWLVGMPLYTGGFYSLLICIVFIANVLFWRHLEEIELENRFPDYKEYKKRTIF